MEPTAAVPGSRRVLRRLRDVMAGSGTAQQRLNDVVRIIAGEMVAEVCSIYVMRAGEVLELFATEGLRPGSRAPHAVARRRRSRRRHRSDGAAPGARRCAVPSRFRLPPRDGRGDFSLAHRRARAARRPGAGRSRRAEPHAAPLHRGRDRGDADDRHDPRRARRLGRIGQSARAAARERQRRFCRCGSKGCACMAGSPWEARCCTSRAS